MLGRKKKSRSDKQKSEELAVAMAKQITPDMHEGDLYALGASTGASDRVINRALRILGLGQQQEK